MKNLLALFLLVGLTLIPHWAFAQCQGGSCSQNAVTNSTASRDVVFVDQFGNVLNNNTVPARTVATRDFVNRLDQSSFSRNFDDSSNLRFQLQSMQRTIDSLNRTIQQMQIQQRVAPAPRINQGASDDTSRPIRGGTKDGDGCGGKLNSFAGLFRPIRGTRGGSSGGCRVDFASLATSTERPIRGGTKDGDGCGGKKSAVLPIDLVACDNGDVVSSRTITVREVPATRSFITREVPVQTVTREVIREVPVQTREVIREREVEVPRDFIVPRAVILPAAVRLRAPFVHVFLG